MRSDLTIVHSRRDAATRETAGLVRTLGWLMLVLTAIPALFIFIGLVAGSLFWLWWTLAQALMGLGALSLSAYLHARAAQRTRLAVYKPSAWEQAEFAAENYEARAA